MQKLLGIAPRPSKRAAAVGRSRGQPRLGAARAAGRLLRRRLGPPRATATRDMLEPGDIEEGLNAAAAIGDDRLQKQAQGYVVPDAFTHGTSAQRVRWFKRGLRAG